MLFNPKKEWNISIYSNTWMDLENTISEVSQKEKDKYYMMSFICGI